MQTFDLIKMKQSCALAAETLLFVGDIINEGMSTGDIDILVHEFILGAFAYPSPLHYQGFPRSICTSRNNVMCHGIPNKNEILENGDIINIDITTFFPTQDGFHGDTSATFYIGTPSEEAQRITRTARECLDLGIAVVKPGVYFGDIGDKIVSHALQNKCSIAPEFVGHGIGKEFHTNPYIDHCGKKNTGKIIEEGMIFTIEPILNLGTSEHIILEDGWTVITKDGSLSAQFEHTILVVENGCEILTERNRPLKNSLETISNKI